MWVASEQFDAFALNATLLASNKTPATSLASVVRGTQYPMLQGAFETKKKSWAFTLNQSAVGSNIRHCAVQAVKSVAAHVRVGLFDVSHTLPSNVAQSLRCMYASGLFSQRPHPHVYLRSFFP